LFTCGAIVVLVYSRFIISVVGYHSLYQWYNSKEGQHFPDPTGLKARIEYWSFGLYPACIKYLMAAYDVPEVCTYVYPFDVPKVCTHLSAFDHVCEECTHLSPFLQTFPRQVYSFFKPLQDMSLVLDIGF
jgi:hypothetical protein